MKNGTYARAIEAGFNSTQADFMAAFGGEIREEAVGQIMKTRSQRLHEAAVKGGRIGVGIIIAAFFVLIGILIGKTI